MSHYPQSGLSGPGMVEGFYLEQYICDITKTHTCNTQKYLSLDTRKPVFWLGPTQTGLCSYRSRLEAWNFWFKKEKLYYLGSKNKAADQLRSYSEAD